MKLWTIGAAVLALVVLAIQPAWGQRPNKEEREKKLLEKFDKDGDGKLSDEEKAAARKAMEASRRAEMLKKFDKDGDGKLSDEEKAAARKAMEERRGGKGAPTDRRAAMLKKFDKDGDGKLSDEEKAAARKAMEASRAKQRPDGAKRRRAGAKPAEEKK